ncbi:MAG: hypothetical protein CR993_04255 [Rhodobacterales bacterium]|nr:MAG: hypothetical protein CR993_04255 [Rhodobacterales bacterium]
MADALLGGIVINEILVDPNGAQNFDTDGNGTAAATDEYIELYNSSDSPIDISGLQLWDQGVGHWFTFPPGTILQPGGHAMVMSGVQPGGSLPTGGPDDLFFDAGRGSPLINNGGDNVTVYDPNSDTFIQATFNGDSLDDPTAGNGGYSGFSSTATRIGNGEDFGNDTDGQSLQRTGDGADTFGSGTPTPGNTNICFANGTFLLTPKGARAIETLKVGDEVITSDHGARKIRWVFAKTWAPEQIAQAPNLAAVHIRQGALGPGLPSRDLRLSQQHRVLVQSAIAQRMFGRPEVLIPAKALLGLPGVHLDFSPQPVTYYHILLQNHEILFANGIPTESLYLGQQALTSIPQAALQEIETILDLSLAALRQGQHQTQPARLLVQGTKASRLIARHRKNHRPVLPPCAPTQLAA